MRIGLEIDGVLADICLAARNSFGCPELDSAYSLEEMFPTISDEVFADWYTCDTTYLHMPVLTGAVDGAAALAEKHTLIVVAARPLYAVSSTNKWLRENGFTVKAALHTNDRESKITALGLDVYVSADPGIINDVSGMVDAYLFSQPFNLHRAVRGKRVMDWDDLLTRLKNE